MHENLRERESPLKEPEIGGVPFLPGNELAPLIEAEETFAEIEAAIVKARHSVHLAYWTIDPALRITSDVTSHNHWAGLLQGAASRGIDVRVAIADFDPVLGFDFHFDAWSAYARFMDMRAELDEESQRRLQVICSRHDATVGWLVQAAGQPIIRRKLDEAVARLNDRSADKDGSSLSELLRRAPGLWPYVKIRDGRLTALRSAFPTVLPAAHHEKLCVIDDDTVFLGGLDLDERRFDTRDHDADLAWHDLSCRLRGPAARQFAIHFRQRWNRELEDFRSVVSALKPPGDVAPWKIPDGLGNLPDLPDLDPETTFPGNKMVAPLRTISRQHKSSFSRSPETRVSEIRDAYLEAIGNAQRLIYIENQFIRSRTIAEALASRAKEQPELEAIILLPVLPQSILEEDASDRATRMGQWLQAEALDILRASFGERIGLYSLKRAGDSLSPETKTLEEILRDSVYSHSKAMIVDDRLALLGSANLNDRSLLTDTETAIAWRDEPSVTSFRNRLWKRHLGTETTSWTDRFTQRWRDVVDQGGEDCFAFPLGEAAIRFRAERSTLVPHELV